MLWMPRDNSIDVNNENLTNFILSLPKADYEHGEKFSYKSPNSDLLGLILQKISNKPLVDIFSDLLWKKIGCSNANITIDDDGLARMAGGLSCTIYDLFRIAEVIRNGGYLNGELLIDPIWVIDTINNGDRNAWEKGEFFDSFPLGNYRNQWYSFNDGILCAIGIHGQWIYIDIPKMIVICKFSSQPEAVDAMLDKLTLKFFEETAKYFV
jgi:CubicO group peptidase (beta-lactamase class C family)